MTDINMTDRWKLIQGDCIEKMRDLPDNSIDSIVTDPPYELGFMGKSWDASGIAYNVELWKQCLRVLKPGGHLLAFSGSRTYHRMTCAIEDAGFEVRDQIMWVYGSGFPKSHNISKALDKAAGAEREVLARNPNSRENCTKDNTLYESGTVGKTDFITAPATEAAKRWDGWGTALKPAHEPICVARKPLEGTVADNVMKWGTGAINIDATRIGFVSEEDKKESTAKNQHADFGTPPMTGNVAYGDYSMVQPKNYNPPGRWPANFMHDGSQQVLDLFPNSKTSRCEKPSDCKTEGDTDFDSMRGNRPARGYDGSAARFFYCPKTSKKDRDEGCEGMEEKSAGVTNQSGRGYKTKCAKCDGYIARSDGVKPCSCEEPEEVYFTSKSKNNHPTVKPTELMRYLCRLVTPKGGTVLDPFNGSGSTGKAAVLEGFQYIGIEKEMEYIKIAEARIARAASK